MFLLNQWIIGYNLVMLYKIFILTIYLSLLSSQSLFNRWIGSDPFIGSSRSTAMGNTHLLNSNGSFNVRYNPSGMGMINSKLLINFQFNRFSVFERWSMPVRDSFGEFLTNADYVANEFSYSGITGGITFNASIPILGLTSLGYHMGPLTHFTYKYSEEVRGSYSIEDGEYASKDPIVGYQNLVNNGTAMLYSIGCGIKINPKLYVGSAINIMNSSSIIDQVNIDTLYSDVTNLTTLPDIDKSIDFPKNSFISLSTTMNLNSNLYLGISFEEKMESKTTEYSFEMDTTNGLLKHFQDSIYINTGLHYVKPEIISAAVSLISNDENKISIDFELNTINYRNHLQLKNYTQYKFGFEYITQSGTPIRAGLLYRESIASALKPISKFTFGTGKEINNLSIDASGTYCFQSFYYPDLFPVEDDIRNDYDLIRDSQFNLQLGLSYKF